MFGYYGDFNAGNALNKKLEKKIATKIAVFDVVIILLMSYFIFLGMYYYSSRIIIWIILQE